MNVRFLNETHVEQLYAVGTNSQPHAIAYGQRASLCLFRLRLVQPQPVQMRLVHRSGLLDEHCLRASLGHSFMALVQSAQRLFYLVLVNFVYLKQRSVHDIILVYIQ